VPNDPRKRKRNRSPGQTQIAISIDVELLAQIRARAHSRQQTISGYLRYLALRDLEAAEKESIGDAFPPSERKDNLPALAPGKATKRKANPGRYDAGESVGSSKAS